jgi:two-component system response regulator HydG
MRRVARQIEDAAALSATVLVTGETGVGKGLVARRLHERSPRRRQPFVHADCAALAPSVLESELFGHERGAFTGAVSHRIGRLERAGDGTLFLDEIGELAPSLQGRLLRVLQDRAFERVGSSEPRRRRARIVAATQRDLGALVATGGFRADLFYRLDVLRIDLPPLRDRADDLPGLIERHLGGIARSEHAAPPRLSEAAHALQRAHRWPGNERELENVLERLCAARPGDVAGAAAARAALRTPLPWPDRVHDAPPSPDRPDAASVLAALRATRGNVAQAARRLGVPRTTLRRRLARIGPADSAQSERGSPVDQHQPQGHGREDTLVEPHEGRLAHAAEDLAAHPGADDDGEERRQRLSKCLKKKA